LEYLDLDAKFLLKRMEHREIRWVVVGWVLLAQDRKTGGLL
jgi:hypothetical protein